MAPATQIEQSRADQGAATVAVGAPGQMEGGIRFTVKNLAVGGDGSGPWLVATVHVENPTGDDATVPNVGIACAGTAADKLGGYQASSTIRLGDDLPARSFRDGTLNLLLPGDSRTGVTTPPCSTPAHIDIQAPV